MENYTLDKISSPQNQKIKEVVKLRNRSERDEKGEFLIEGYRELSRAVQGGAVITSLFVCSEYFLGENEEDLIVKVEDTGASLFECTPSVFTKISYRDRPDGLLAVAEKRPLLLRDLQCKNPVPFVLLAVRIEKPGNLGTILRSADAVGADAVIVVDRVTDIYNPNVVRASVGTLFTLPVIETTSEEVVPWLKKHGFQMVASSPAAQKNYVDADFKKPTAILVGSEQYGLSKEWFEIADEKISIPMKGVADSLNVATSTTLLLYEVLRQRSYGL